MPDGRIDSLLFRYQLAPTDGVTAIVSLATEDGPDPSMILDIDCFVRKSFPTDEDALRRQLRKVRDAKNRIFFASLTTEAIERFNLRDLALLEAFCDCSESDWDGYGAAPANALSMEWARKVLEALPSCLGVPEVAFEPDGDAGLEWWRGPDMVLSVSVGRNGELRYAARLNAARTIGTEIFADGLPKRLVEAAYELV